MALTASLAFRLEVQRHAIDAVPKTCRARAIFEHMPEVTLAAGAMDLGTDHSVGAIRRGFNGILNGLPEARPSSAAVELGPRCEELLTASRASKPPLAVFLVQRTRPGSLCSVIAQNLKLLGRQRRAPFIVGFWKVHPANLPDWIDSEE